MMVERGGGGWGGDLQWDHTSKQSLIMWRRGFQVDGVGKVQEE